LRCEQPIGWPSIFRVDQFADCGIGARRVAGNDGDRRFVAHVLVCE
jgi:hypothetical protein